MRFYAALAIGLIRMAFMAFQPLALTGRYSARVVRHFYTGRRRERLFLLLGEVIGTGIIGAIVSYPVMALLWGRTGAYMAVLCAVLYSGNINRRQYRLFILKAVTQHETADKVPAHWEHRFMTK